MESIGGYRIIRKLGAGTRSEVFLGHAGLGPAGEPHLAAIKVFRADAPTPGIDAEIAALSRLDSPHIVRLEDLASSPDGRPCLILQRLEPGGLARVFAGREALAAGEAVTILAPLAEAIASMHREGIVHKEVSALAVLFDAAGAPVLTGFGGSGFIDGGHQGVTPAALEQHPGVRGDLDALVLLAESVLARVHDSRDTTGDILHWLKLPRTGDARYPSELQERLFALATPIPVQFAADPARRAPLPQRFDVVGRSTSTNGGAPDGADGGTPPSAASEADHHAATGSETSRWRALLPPRIQARVVQGQAWAHDRLAVLRGAAGAVRRRVWVVAGLGVAAAMVAVVLIPIAGPGAEPPQRELLPTGSPTDIVHEYSAILGDDPVAAARELLAARASCLNDRSILCLDGVDQPDSAAWMADAARIRDIQRGAELAPDRFDRGATPAIIDRMGDTALVSLPPEPSVPPVAMPAAPDSAGESTDATASVLMIKTEAGWRFRSLLTGAESVG